MNLINEIIEGGGNADEVENEVLTEKIVSETYEKINLDIKGPINYFNGVFDDEIITEICTETNLYSMQTNGVELHCAPFEIRRFIGVLFYLGVIQVPNMRMAWTPSFKLSAVADSLSKTRFEKIKGAFHLNDSTKQPQPVSPDYDKLYKIRPLLARLKEKCNKLQQEEHQSIDEQMIKFKGHNSLKAPNSNYSDVMKRITIGDESWLYPYDPEKYDQSTEYLGKDESKPKKTTSSQVRNQDDVDSFFDYRGFKNGAHKLEQQQQQQQQLEHTAKLQATAGGKRFSGSHSNNSNSNCGSARGSGSGSGSGVSGGNATNNRNSIGNGSCVSTSTTSAAATSAAAGTGKRRKSKPTKCFSSTVFRCCIPCRGGGSAAPATSPPHSPATPADDVNNGTSITAAIQKKYAKAANEKKRDSGNISAPYAELDADVDADVEVEAVAANGKKHSLADTIATSATTPISLKTIINDNDELEPPTLSVADIAAATLASGIVARKAEPETLSDASVSPTAAIQQPPYLGAPINVPQGLNANGSAALSISAQQISPTKTPSNVSTVTSLITVIGQISNAATLQQQQQTQQQQQQQQVPPPPPPAAQSAPRVSQSQTSPLPHIKEEEESEHIGNRHQYSPPVDAEQAVGGTLTTVSDSSESTNAPQSTNTSFSAPTSGHQELVTPSASTPSPRIKLKFRKQHKSAWSRSVLAPSSATSSVAGVGGGSGGGGAGGGSGSGGATSNETLASNGSNTNTATSVSSGGLHRISLSSVPHASSSAQLLPATKMQAEQGSIGDLQKYHSRYLKNRRHTLANVR
ncbi:PREDICTED: cAMP-specific 3',5'-cyclic phosphodiesterase-like [Bactrocera latifrons]|nr:PREDICTED: cAMP-specific 3',5'-cyclic phosphodiesterase-like [Bactrocera latifrons]